MMREIWPACFWGIDFGKEHFEMNLVILRTFLMLVSIFLASTFSGMNAIKEEIFNRIEGLTFFFQGGRLYLQNTH